MQVLGPVFQGLEGRRTGEGAAGLATGSPVASRRRCARGRCSNKDKELH